MYVTFNHRTQPGTNLLLYSISTKGIEINKVKKKMLFNKTRQYNIKILDKIFFLKYRTRQLKATVQKVIAGKYKIYGILGAYCESTLTRKEMCYLMTHSTHFIYGYLASDIW